MYKSGQRRNYNLKIKSDLIFEPGLIHQSLQIKPGPIEPRVTRRTSGIDPSRSHRHRACPWRRLTKRRKQAPVRVKPSNPARRISLASPCLLLSFYRRSFALPSFALHPLLPFLFLLLPFFSVRFFLFLGFLLRSMARFGGKHTPRKYVFLFLVVVLLGIVLVADFLWASSSSSPSLSRYWFRTSDRSVDNVIGVDLAKGKQVS